MSGFADYERYDALGLADLVRRKAVNPNDLIEVALERVKARNAGYTPSAEVYRFEASGPTTGALWRQCANDPPPWRRVVKLVQRRTLRLGFHAATVVRHWMESHEGCWYSRQETLHLQTGAPRTKPLAPRRRAQENSLRQRGLPPLKKTAHGAVAL